MAALADSEAEALLDCDRGDELDFHLDVIARHNHLRALGETDNTRHVRGTEVELRTIVREERRMTAALFLRQDVDLRLELRVRVNGTRLCENLAALNVLAVHTAEQCADVVAGNRAVEQLAEHLNARNNRAARLILKADDLNRIVQLQLTALHTTRCDRAAARDREDILDRHEERLVRVTRRRRDIVVDCIHELQDLCLHRIVTLERLQRGACNDGDLIAGEVIARKELANFHLNELEELGIVNLVNLVEEDNDRGNANLASEQDVLTRLGHRAVCCGDDEDRAVHLCSTRDHVLDIVRMARAVHVCIVTLVRLILNVCRVDRDAALTLLRCLVDVRIVLELRIALLGENLRDRRRQRRLAVVNVTDRADVDMGLAAVKLFLCHLTIPPYSPLFLATTASAIFLGTSS